MRRIEKRLARRLAFITTGMHPEIVTGLEHLPPEAVDVRLAALKELSSRICFLISTTFADEIDADGSNRNRTIRPADWWQAAVGRHFPEAILLKGPKPDSAVLLTWKPGFVIRLVIGHERRRQSLARSIERFRSTRLQRQQPPGNVSGATLFERLNDRTVALVGNSRALSERAHGPDIDAHDIVIRCNRAPIFHTRSHGARTDWIATSAEIPENLPVKRGVSHILWMSPRRDRMPVWLLRFPHLFVNPAENNRALAARIGSRPSTGMMVIDLLVRSQSARIDLYGFDFFQSQSVSGNQTKASAPHDFDGEQALVQAWAERDRRLTIHR
jgi:hypothetical protein